ncbi:MAG: hypothetical protein ACTHU0_29890, partial [Kofleriaceae bacterium]
LIVVWAPDHDVTPIAAAARELGAALIDRSPATSAGPSIDASIERAIEAYDALQLDAAWTTLEEARRSLDHGGHLAISNARLSDLFVYRGLIRTQRADAEGAWEELAAAIAVAPARVLDPARFSPRTIEEVERTRKVVTARPRAALSIEAPPDCAIELDGAAAPSRELAVIAGSHWVSAACAGAAPWSARIDVADPGARLRVTPAPLEPPTDAEVLVQARTAAARGVVVAEVRGAIATVRWFGLDGRERDRRSVAVASHARGALEPVADAMRALLRPRPTERWYQSRWVWAAGAAGLVAAIFVPLTISLSNTRPSGVDVVGPGRLP